MIEKLIRLETRGPEVWYSVGTKCEENLRWEEWQFGGYTLTEAISNARNRFGKDYKLIPCEARG